MRIVDTTKVLVRNKEGKYLVLRCSEWPDRPDRSLKPDLPGGEVDSGEDYERAAMREVKEEAGIDVSDLSPVYLNSYVNEVGISVNRIIFLAEANISEVILSWEHVEYWWSALDDLIALDWHDSYKKSFKYLKENKILK